MTAPASPSRSAPSPVRATAPGSRNPTPIAVVPTPPRRPAEPSPLLAHLLKVEADARCATSERELCHLAVNETRTLTRARQVVLVGRGSGHRVAITTVSSLAAVDRETPLVRWMEGLLGRISRQDGLTAPRELVLPAYCEAGDETAAGYPFPNLLWIPLWTGGAAPTEGLLLARETPWLAADRTIAERLAVTIGHALALLRARRRPLLSGMATYRWLLLAAPLLVLLGLLPVPISALAPVEVTPRDATVVAMPVDGTVGSVLVGPNEAVTPGQPLVRLVDTVARNRHEVAVREVGVAEARLERASSLAFTDPKGRYELGLARAELALKLAERKYASDVLAQQSMVATAAGIAVYADRRDLEGKPLPTGERLMQIAEPGRVELRIDLPVADSIVLAPGAKVRAFLDSDPLNARDGIVTRIDYQPRLTEAGVAAYRVIASVDDDGRGPPRLGTRGTVQVQGPPGTLGLLLFRRPIAALRQWVGL